MIEYYEQQQNIAPEADINFKRIGKAIQNGLITYGLNKLENFIVDKLTGCNEVSLSNDANTSSVKLMYRLVDNSKPYEEFIKNREIYDLNINLRINRDKNDSFLGDLIGNII